MKAVRKVNKIIGDVIEPLRLDLFLSERLDDYSRNHIQKMIEENKVLVNGLKQKSNYKVKKGDIVEYEDLEEKKLDVKPESLNLEIVYEDKNVAVVYKPKGMVVHPGAGREDHTLVNGLLYQIQDLSSINGVVRPGIVHRIDKDTTGLLIICKNDKAHRKLADDLKNKKVRRVYYAIVEGMIKEDDGVIDAPIGRDPKNRLRMAVVKGGKEAVTTFHVIERFKDKTYVECVLKTGRTHQIRVHFQYIGHSVVGDPLYSRKTELTKYGQFLHAGIIGFNDPDTKEYREFSYPLPPYFNDYLNELRKEKKN